MRRYRCAAAGCGWRGLLDDPGIPGAGVAVPRRAMLAMATLAGILAAATAGWMLHRPSAPERVLVGPHVVHRGTHLEGDRLPADHPVTAYVQPARLEREPTGYTNAPDAQLHLRRHCAWGLPGRNPYRGSTAQALQTAQLSPTVVQAIAADILAGRKVDRVTVRNDGIVAERSGRVFDQRRVAMTYGMTMCVDTRVNFKPGHAEGADLYEAMDDDGRIYAVMVPDVCGNVSVLGQRYVREAMPSAGAASAADPRPWLRLPPELRPRLLPDRLRYTDYREPKGGGDGDEGDAELPEPGTLLLAGLAMAAAVALGRHRRA
jgi:hypothetical protein